MRRMLVLTILSLSLLSRSVHADQVTLKNGDRLSGAIVKSDDDAKMLLIIVYNREGRHGDALKLSDELHQKYPKNFLFEMTRAQILRKLGKFDQANDTYQNILKKIAAKSNGYERLRALDDTLAATSPVAEPGPAPTGAHAGAARMPA